MRARARLLGRALGVRALGDGLPAHILAGRAARVGGCIGAPRLRDSVLAAFGLRRRTSCGAHRVAMVYEACHKRPRTTVSQQLASTKQDAMRGACTEVKVTHALISRHNTFEEVPQPQ